VYYSLSSLCLYISLSLYNSNRLIKLVDIGLQLVLSILNFLHLFATVIWIGGMTTNMLVLLPSMREALEPAIAGRFLGVVMRRFRRLVYGSIFLLILAGVPMELLNDNGNTWSQLIMVKHLFVIALVLLTIYSFEVLAPKVAKLATKGPSPELAKLQRLQLRLAATGLLLGIIILLFAGILISL
jgi:uncharacterized membrane protein